MTALRYGEVLGAQSTTRIFAAYLGPSPVAAVTVDTGTDTVELAYVMDDFRGQGIATKLLALARVTTGSAIGFHTGALSPLGAAWSRSRGLRKLPTANPYAARKLDARQAAGMGAGLLVALYGCEVVSLDAAVSAT